MATQTAERTPTAEALSFLEQFLVRSNDRSMFSKAELQDLALDLHNILDPVESP